MALGLRAASVSTAATAAGAGALGRQNSPAGIKDAGRVQARDPGFSAQTIWADWTRALARGCWARFALES